MYRPQMRPRRAIAFVLNGTQKRYARRSASARARETNDDNSAVSQLLRLYFPVLLVLEFLLLQRKMDIPIRVFQINFSSVASGRQAVVSDLRRVRLFGSR